MTIQSTFAGLIENIGKAEQIVYGGIDFLSSLSTSQRLLNGSAQLDNLPLLGDNLKEYANSGFRILSDIADDAYSSLASLDQLGAIAPERFVQLAESSFGLDLSSISSGQEGFLRSAVRYADPHNLGTTILSDVDSFFGGINNGIDNLTKVEGLWSNDAPPPLRVADLSQHSSTARAFVAAALDQSQSALGGASPSELAVAVFNQALGYNGLNLITREITSSDLGASVLDQHVVASLARTAHALTQAAQALPDRPQTSFDEPADVLLSIIPSLEATSWNSIDDAVSYLVKAATGATVSDPTDISRITNVFLSSAIRSTIDAVASDTDGALPNFYKAITNELGQDLLGIVGSVLDGPIGQIASFLVEMAGSQPLPEVTASDIAVRFLASLRNASGSLDSNAIGTAFRSALDETDETIGLSPEIRQALEPLTSGTKFESEASRLGLLSNLDQWLLSGFGDAASAPLSTALQELAPVSVTLQEDGIHLSLEPLQGAKHFAEVPLDSSLNLGSLLEVETDGSLSLSYTYNITLPEVTLPYSSTSQLDVRAREISLGVAGSLDQLDARTRVGPFLYTATDITSDPELEFEISLSRTAPEQVDVTGSIDTTVHLESSKKFKDEKLDGLFSMLPDVGIDLHGAWTWSPGDAGPEASILELKNHCLSRQHACQDARADRRCNRAVQQRIEGH